MRAVHDLVLATVMLAATPAIADPWKDESGHGGAYGYYEGEWKEEWRDGPCKYERKWEGSGGHKEEVKCDGYEHGHYAGPSAYIPMPAGPSITIIVPVD